MAIFDDFNLQGVKFERVKHTAPWSIKMPAGNEARLYAVLQGKAELQCEALGRTVVLEAGSVITVRTGQAHQWKQHKISNKVCELFIGTIPHKQLPIISSYQPILILNNLADPRRKRIVALIEVLVMEQALNDDATPAIMHRLAEVISIELSREQVLDKQQLAPQLSYVHRGIQEAIRLLHDAPQQQHSLNSLANAACLSRSAFTQQFRQAIGMSVNRYRLQLIMNRASEDLRIEHDSINQIATRYGFKSESAFVRAFKREIGATPGRYRKNARQGV